LAENLPFVRRIEHSIVAPYYLLATGSKGPTMKRRDFVQLAAGAAIAWPLLARAQQRAMPLVGLLRTVTAVNDQGIDVFRRALRELGYVEGQNIRVEVRWSDGDDKRLAALAAELAALKPDVIVTNGSPALRAVKAVAGTIPIVMSVIDNPVALGVAQSFAHPGGNLTGLSNLAAGLLGKRLELLVQTVPNPGCVAVLGNPQNASWADGWREITAAAQTLGIEPKAIAARSESELATAFAGIAGQHCGALLVISDAIYFGARVRLAELAARHRVPASYDNRQIVAAGGLMSYGPDTNDMVRRAASYVDKILKGANPADLPIEQPTRFELAINMKTAKALGLIVPQSILVRADEVIE
jgi:putative ABC transport system substrate-binding protein